LIRFEHYKGMKGIRKPKVSEGVNEYRMIGVLLLSNDMKIRQYFMC